MAKCKSRNFLGGHSDPNFDTRGGNLLGSLAMPFEYLLFAAWSPILDTPPKMLRIDNVKKNLDKIMNKKLCRNNKLVTVVFKRSFIFDADLHTAFSFIFH
jgi:hypothetical protein